MPAPPSATRLRRSAPRCRRSSRRSTTSATTRCSTSSRRSCGSRAPTDGKLPLTLVVLDEMQQYIDDDNDKALNVQNLVEGCSSRFGSQVLVVATGQAALTANPTLQKLIDRFSVTVALSDTDVETVVRKVVLRKKPGRRSTPSRRRSTRSAARSTGTSAARGSRRRRPTRPTLVADYPLLPTRRRFWERALRAIDKAGKAGVLRTQLKIVHEAARSVADQPLGHVIGGDFVFRSESASMLQSGVLLKEIDELIRGLEDGTADGELKSRACALVFLISQLPHEGVGDTGVRATAPVIADLLVEDLAADGARSAQGRAPSARRARRAGPGHEARRRVPAPDRRGRRVDEGLQPAPRGDPRRRRADVAAPQRVAPQGRSTTSSPASSSSTARARRRGSSTATGATTSRPSTARTIPVWIRDEWYVTEAKVRGAAAAGRRRQPGRVRPAAEDRRRRDPRRARQLRRRAGHRQPAPEPQTDEGRQAKQGMQSRVQRGRASGSATLFGAVVAKARVFQGGGNELTTVIASRRGRDRRHATRSPACSRSSAPPTTRTGSKVITKARDGAPDALDVGRLGRRGPGQPRVQGGARGGPPVPGRRAATSSASSATRRTAGRRTPSTGRSSRCSPAATSGPSATATRWPGRRSCRRPRSARPPSTRRTSRPARRSGWPSGRAHRGEGAVHDRPGRAPRSVACSSTSSTSRAVPAGPRRCPSRRTPPTSTASWRWPATSSSGRSRSMPSSSARTSGHGPPPASSERSGKRRGRSSIGLLGHAAGLDRRRTRFARSATRS